MPTSAGWYYSVNEGGQVDLPPVILIHGAGGSHLNWPAEMRRLTGQRVIAVDLPGHGRSVGFGQQSILAYADALHDFMNGLGLRESVLVGHSMGGAVALTLALKYPRYAAGLGLIATGAYLGVDRALVQELSHPATVQNGLNRLQTLAFSPASRPALVEACMKPLRDLRPSLLLADWLACASFDLRDLIEQIHAPAWVVCGADDRITPLPYANFLAARLPGAVLQTIPAAGHMVILEQPARVAEGLGCFLANQMGQIQSYRAQLALAYSHRKP